MLIIPLFLFTHSINVDRSTSPLSNSSSRFTDCSQCYSFCLQRLLVLSSRVLLLTFFFLLHNDCGNYMNLYVCRSYLLIKSHFSKTSNVRAARFSFKSRISYWMALVFPSNCTVPVDHSGFSKSLLTNGE